MPFIDRKKELAALDKLWSSKQAEFFVLYGKRRVGKTELIKQFIKDKKGVYFLADKRTTKDQLIELGRIVGQHFDDHILTKRGFTDWLEVFEYLQKKCARTPFVLAVDEYPYLVEVDKATSSLFQKGWDEYLKESNVTLILCGSSIAMMEGEALDYKSPLYGRRTAQLLLKPLTFYQAQKFFPKQSFGEFLETYTISGGLPAYLLALDKEKAVLDNIKDSIFPRTSFLHNEIEFVLKQELREPKNYMAILRALALGKTKLGEIINTTGLEKNVVNKYLGVLAQLQLTKRTVPITEKKPEKSRMGLYKITDNFTRFWFQYIYPYKSDLEIERYNEVLRKLDESFLMLVAETYEQVCQEIVSREQDRFFRFERIGKWWAGNQEIDIVALNEETKEIVFGECKWSNKPVGTNIYRELKKKTEAVEWNAGQRKEYFVLFSKSGFTDDMKEATKKDRAVLVEGDRVVN